jgi:hypothetical protein
MRETRSFTRFCCGSHLEDQEIDEALNIKIYLKQIGSVGVD